MICAIAAAVRLTRTRNGFHFSRKPPAPDVARADREIVRFKLAEQTGQVGDVVLEIAVHAAEKLPLRRPEPLDDARLSPGFAVVQDGADIRMAFRRVGVDRRGRAVGRVFVGDDDFVVFKAAFFDAADEEQDVLPFIQRRNDQWNI